MASIVNSADFDDTIELWVKSVVEYSSQYNETSWAAENVIGEPRVFPRYGDLNGAWAQGNVTANEFVVVEFAEKLFLTGIEIYETFNAGALIRLSAFDHSADTWVKFWDSERPQLFQYSRCFVPQISELSFPTCQIKLELDCTVAQSWCEIDAVKVKGKRHLAPKPPSILELSEDLKQLVNSSVFSDVKFLVEGQEVYAHRAILSVRSAYFRALLSNGMLESMLLESNKGIKIDDISYDGFVAMMHYIYTNDFDPSTSTLLMTEMIRIADRLSLNGMKTLSFCHLCKNINLNNAIDIYCDATEKLPHLEDIENICLKFISKNLSKVTQLATFCNLSKDVMLLIVQEATSRLSLDKA